MKNVKKLHVYLFVMAVCCIATFFVSCDGFRLPAVEEATVGVYSVWTSQEGTTSTEITGSYLGRRIRLKGFGFTGLTAVYCNGLKASYNTSYVSDNSITFTIPTTTPIAEDMTDTTSMNVIKVVTNHGNAYFSFTFKKTSVITKVSNTLPNEGDVITLTGNYLLTTTAVSFPSSNGYVDATEFTVVDKTTVTAVTPSGVGDISGSIRILCNEGDTVYSPAYMFYENGIFLKSFKESYIVASPSNGAILGDSASIAQLTGLAQNPDTVLAFPAQAGSIAIKTSLSSLNSFIKWYPSLAISAMLKKTSSEITSSTSMEDLAIQFDLYSPYSWSSGAIPYKHDKNYSTKTSALVYNYLPWSVGSPYTFSSGWETVTINFSDFTGITLTSIGASTIATTSGLQSLIGFINIDANGDGHTATVMNQFQLFIANVRIVPTETPVTSDY
ncbi:MAG: hypothetical protein H6Q14_2941 [Bacteroidetes bacterium]|nr:hypothetical protein [Bacteroidota bacterium]